MDSSLGVAAAPHMDPPPATVRATSLGRRVLIETPAPLALVLVTFVIHDVPTAVRLPYWLDEAWVAASVRLPVSDLPTTTGSTPIGWSALLRLVPDIDWLRLLPIAFLVLSVLAGYALAAAVPWPSTAHRLVAGLATGLAVALLPNQQLRHELKQYTADAAVALILLALAGFVEATYSRRRLALLVATATIGVLISHVTILVGGCVAGGLVLAALARRQWRHSAEAAVAGLVMLGVFGAAYLGLVRGADNDTMVRFWGSFFPAFGDLPTYLANRMHTLQPFLGANWLLLLLLAVAGVLTAALRGRPAIAGAALLLPPTMMLAGVTRRYPLLDGRTSHFLLVCLIGFAAIGVAGIATLVVRRSRHSALLAGVLVVAVLGGYAYRTADWFRFDGDEPGLPVRFPATSDDIRAPVAYVWAHRRPGDIVLVSGTATYGFAVYWPQQPGYRLDRVTAVGWQPTYTDPSIVVVLEDDAASIHHGIVTATGLAAKSGPDAVVWVIRTHLVRKDRAAWNAEFAGLTVHTTPSGNEPALRLVAW